MPAEPRDGGKVVPFGVPRLTRGEVAFVLAVAVGLFLFLEGPIWAHRWDPDRSILWSYTPILPLVLLLLLRGRRLRVSSLFLETLKVALLKFGITASILMVFWGLDTPPRPIRRRVSAPPAEPRDTPAPPSAIPASRLGALAGSVLDRAGAPLPGATVWVAAGLERYVFTPPDTAAMLEIAGGRVTPLLLTAAVGQELRARSGDGRLHTLHVVAETGTTLLNAPLLASGALRSFRFQDPGGLCAVRCEVHPEERGGLLLLAHPFATVADASGRYLLRGVPTGALVVAVLAEGHQPARLEVRVIAGETREARLRVE